MMMNMLRHIIVYKLIHLCVYMFSDRGNRQKANHFLIRFLNDIFLLTAFGLVVFEKDDVDDDILYIFSLCFHTHRQYLHDVLDEAVFYGVLRK